MAERTRVVWAVPVSSGSPHLAHLIVLNGEAVTRRICNNIEPVTLGFALFVDFEDYEPKCRHCRTRLREGRARFELLPTKRPRLKTSHDITAHASRRRLRQPIGQ